MNQVIINGIRYEFNENFNNVSINNGIVTVNGKQMNLNETSKEVNVLISGNVKMLDVDGSVTVNGNVSNVDCGGSCEITGNVYGDIDAGGSVKCDHAIGNIRAGGSVTCRKR